MEGSLFFWLSWCIWIYVTFIMDKRNKIRFPLAFFLLTTICLIGIEVEFFGLQIAIAAIYLLLLSYLAFLKESFWNLIYKMISIFILSAAVAFFFLFSLYDPVWIFINQEILFGLFITLLSILLFTNFKTRLFAVIIGLIQGEILYGITLNHLSIHYQIGSLQFMDYLAFTCLLIAIWSGIEYLHILFQHKTYQQEKEKQL